MVGVARHIFRDCVALAEDIAVAGYHVGYRNLVCDGAYDRRTAASDTQDPQRVARFVTRFRRTAEQDHR
jgi:hypothetical protein